jgi:acetylornithine deacetylase/succinyl-diaminopimelate desuccinylase-like protein
VQASESSLDAPGISGGNASASDPVELLRALLRFDTSNPPGNERACLEFVADLLRGAGVEPRFLERDPERPNLVARVNGRGEVPPLLLYGHVDVVPAKAEEWRHPPFAGELVDGEVWGRGALDMKSGVAMLVTALLRLRAEGIVPTGDVILVLASDEERGSEVGAKFLVEEHGDLFANVRYAIGEFGGFTRWIGGRRFYPIQVAEKQAVTIRATVRGQGGHPSVVVRTTAAAKLARFLSAVTRKRLPIHITPVVTTMLDTMARGLPVHERIALRPLLTPALTDRVLALLGKDGDSLQPLVRNTVTATVIRGGESTNVIPTEIEVDLDGRLLPGQTPADLVRELEGIASGLATFEILREEPAVPTAPDLTLLPMLREIIREREPGARTFPMLLPGYTDARYFARLGIQTYGFLPLRLPKDFPTELIHAPNERVPAEAVRFGADCVYEAVRRYSGVAADPLYNRG